MLPFISGFKKYKCTYKKNQNEFFILFCFVTEQDFGDNNNYYYSNVLALHCTIFTSLYGNHCIWFPQQHRLYRAGNRHLPVTKKQPQPPTPAQGWQKVEEKKESGLRRIMTSLLVFNPGFLCPNNYLLGRILKPFLYSHSYPQRLLPFLPLKLVGLRI